MPPPDSTKPPPSPPNSPAGGKSESGPGSGSESQREGPSRRERRAKDERHHPEAARRGRRAHDPEPEKEDDEGHEHEHPSARAVVKCRVCHRMVGGGAAGMAHHVENSKVHAAWIHYGKGMTWKKAMAKANQELDRHSWSAPPSETHAPAKESRIKISRSPARGDRHESREEQRPRARLPSVEREGRGRSRSRRERKHKGITRGEEDLIIAQALRIQAGAQRGSALSLGRACGRSEAGKATACQSSACQSGEARKRPEGSFCG